jgi:hypothetical protein
MLIEFRDGDRQVCSYALILLEKALADVRQKMELLTLDSMVVQKEQGRLECAQSTMEDSAGQVDVEFTHDEARSLRLALKLYYAKLAELSKAEVKLLIDTMPTEGRMATINDLIVRFGGQTTLKLEVTVTHS